MPKGNPNPTQTEDFRRQQFARYGDEKQPLASKVIGLRLPVDVDAALREMPDAERVAWLRQLISQAVRDRLSGEQQQTSSASEAPPSTTTRRRPARAAAPAPKPELEEDEGFRVGDCVRLPSGDRAFVERVLPDGRYRIRWEMLGSGGLDECPQHMLVLVNRGA